MARNFETVAADAMIDGAFVAGAGNGTFPRPDFGIPDFSFPEFEFPQVDPPKFDFPDLDAQGFSSGSFVSGSVRISGTGAHHVRASSSNGDVRITGNVASEDPDDVTIELTVGGVPLALFVGAGVAAGIGTLRGTGFNDRVANHGHLVGDIRLGDGRDVFRGSGDLVGQVFGGAGADRLLGNDAGERFLGGAGADLVRGGRGADVLRGGGGNDAIFGGAGRDLIDGGAGDDMLTGGPGPDRYLFRPDQGDDVVTGFDDGRDLIDLAAFGFTDAAEVTALARDTVAGLSVDLSDQGGGTILLEQFLSTQFDGSDLLI